MKRELLLMRDIVDCQLLDPDGERVTKVAGVYKIASAATSSWKIGGTGCVTSPTRTAAC